MRFAIAYALFRKDLLEALRDRRTLALLVGVPMLLYPLILVGSVLMSGMANQRFQEQPLKLAIWGPAPASVLEQMEKAEHVEWVERRDAIPEAPAREAQKLMEERQVQVVLTVKTVPVEGAGESLVLELYFDTGRLGSAVARKRLDKVLEGVRLHAVRGRFEQAGLSPELAEPLQVKETNFRSMGIWLAWVLPYLLLCALVMSGFYPAIDVTAGEKERGTLQTLLCAPVRPLEVVLGKYGVVSIFTLGGALVNLGAMGLAIVGIAGGAMGRVHVSVGVLAAVFAALVPLALLVSAMLVAVGVMARSFKEGQNYLTPLLLVVMAAAHAAMVPGLELTPGLAMVPLVNVSLLLRELLTAKVSAGIFGVVFTTTLAWAVAGLLFAARVFESEQVLLSGEKPWRDVFGRKVRRGDHFSPGSALLYFAVVLVGSLFAGVLLWKRLPMWGVLAVSQVGIFLAVAVLWVKRSGADMREVFSLRLPTGRGALAVLLLVPGVFGLQGVLSRVLETVSPPGTEEFMRLLELLMKESARWPLALALAVVALAPAVCEEAAFRGVMLSGLSRTGSRTVAVVGSALTFGLLHIHPVHVLIAAVVGLVLGYATLGTRSLLAGVVLHFVNNASSVLLARMETQPAWTQSWQVTLVLCVPGVVALWLLRGEAAVPAPEQISPVPRPNAA
ncbi:hypothetical protein BO221_10715 [Archangium sp. Cb G35]|uniref:ABC transporter permease subunit/CPBP intramembrane protease n=1 Tax=Archangium sp. Cb G35 TaxID=1920190 RepID=UPI0009374FC7|nr:ABC transporter permease subunit/CPBP intramembrane protease [Archangium sp. Cb G35]OJT24868.1 hypothetical protein BO221_10715 [Archangium sp. Cb G35]